MGCDGGRGRHCTVLNGQFKRKHRSRRAGACSRRWRTDSPHGKSVANGLCAVPCAAQEDGEGQPLRFRFAQPPPLAQGRHDAQRTFSGGDDCKNHYHLKCLRCGELLHVECGFLDEMGAHVLEHHGFVVDTQKITICGVCEKCAKA